MATLKRVPRDIDTLHIQKSLTMVDGNVINMTSFYDTDDEVLDFYDAALARW